MTFEIVTTPVHGSLSGSGASWTYAPDRDYNGSDEFTFRASDGEAVSNTATVRLTVAAVNDPPLVADFCKGGVTLQASPTGKVVLDLSGHAMDVDGDALTWTLVTKPGVGSLSGKLPIVTFRFPWSSSGETSFTWRVSDGKVASSSATATIRSGSCPPATRGRKFHR